jgi:hypothetical protein
LLVADHRQHRAQLLVLGNRPLVDLTKLVESAVGEFNAAAADGQPAIRIIDTVTRLPIAALACSLGSGDE